MSNRHTLSWDLEPADIVQYDSPIGNVQQAIIEVNHNSSGESNFQLLSYEAGLEAVLTGFGDGDDADSEEDEVDRSFQIVKVNKSGIGIGNLRVTGRLSVKPVIATLARTKTSASNAFPDIHAGVLLGHRDAGYGAGRSALGFGVTRRISGTHAGSTITVTSTDGFADSGHLILDDKSFVSYSGKTATTFTGVTLISGVAIVSPIAEMRMLRPRAHEMRTTKGRRIRRKI